jgi:hypothetical protein
LSFGNPKSKICNPKFPMKGPYERLKYDLRRLWECPVCKRRERTGGTITFRFCPCEAKKEGGQPVVMHLIADGPQRLVPPVAAARGQCVQSTPAADDMPARSASEGDVPGGVVEPAPPDESNAPGTRFGPG